MGLISWGMAAGSMLREEGWRIMPPINGMAISCNSFIWEKKLALEADRPLGTVLRSGDIVEGLDGEVDGQLAEMDDFAEAPADGHGPHIA